MAHVFISYSRKDTEFVNRIEVALKQQGIITWRDVDDLEPDAGWFQRIREALEASYAMLYVATEHSETSEWVAHEWTHARWLGLPIIPVKQDEKFYSFRVNIFTPVVCDDQQFLSGIDKIISRLQALPQDAIIPGARPPIDPPTRAMNRIVTSVAIETYLQWLLSKMDADLKKDAMYVNLSAEAAQRLPRSVFHQSEDDDFGRVALERITGEHFDQPGETVADARTTLLERRRVILLGDPGAGKTTTLQQLAVDLARAAQQDPANAKLPVFVPLRQFNGDLSFAEFIEKQTYNLQDVFADLLKNGRLVLLCDALNEMPRRSADGRDLVAEVRDALRTLPDWVVSCRVRDYQEELSELKDAAKVRLQPLDPPRIYEFIKRGFAAEGKPEQGEVLWEAMGGSDGLVEWWHTYNHTRRSYDFWEFGKGSALLHYDDTPLRWLKADQEQGRLLVDRWRILRLCRNPYLTNRVCLLYSRTGQLPPNRGALFALFVNELLKREEKASYVVGAAWLDTSIIRKGLAHIAFEMVSETEMPRAQVDEILNQQLPGVDHALLLRLAMAASLLDVGENVRFTHQLLQEYFASEVLGVAIDADADPTQYWPPDSWWQPNGREETLIILAGVRGDPEAIARWVAPAQPDLAFQVLRDSGIPVELDDLTRQTLIDVGTQYIASSSPQNTATPNLDIYNRAAGYRVLGRLHADLRPGLTVDDIIWCDIEAGDFLYGEDKETRRIDQPYAISKYPVTNAQFAPFIAAGSYQEPRFWTKAGWEAKEYENWIEPRFWRDPDFNIPNHPVVGVSWYEAYAYTQWLTEYLNSKPTHHTSSAVGTPYMASVIDIRLPTETQRERAARHTDGRIYPWGNDWDAARCNNDVEQPAIRQTSAVGIFLAGDSPCGASDMAGNVWEWCMTEYNTLAEDGEAEATNRTEVLHVLRGGSWSYGPDLFRVFYRNWYIPHGGSLLIGFRISRSSIALDSDF